jgi:hypothetical protein
MVPLCRHLLSSNKTCGSPALRGQYFCYHHHPSRRLSGPRRPTTRSSYRWYAFYRKISTMRPEQALTVWNQVAEAVLNHEISQEWVFRIMNRYTARVRELGAQMRQHQA